VPAALPVTDLHRRFKRPCEILRAVAYTGDDGLMLIKRAPYGVLIAVTPTTNPTETILCNAIGIVAAGNAVVFNLHPSAAQVCNWCVHLLNEAIQSAGPPLARSTRSAVPAGSHWTGTVPRGRLAAGIRPANTRTAGSRTVGSCAAGSRFAGTRITGHLLLRLPCSPRRSIGDNPW
jgi:hypothetical protein